MKNNSIAYEYSLCFVPEKEIKPLDFDISKSGEYRIRISVDEISDTEFIDNYDTVYAYFRLVVV